MSFLRPIALLLIFIGLLYYFHVPLSNTGSNISTTVLQPIESFFKGIGSASSSIPGYTVLPSGSTDYPQGVTGTGSSSVSTSSDPGEGTTTADIINAIENANSTSGDSLPPVQSDAASHDDSALSVDGIISITNKYRVQQGLSVLTENKLLDASATEKLEDMFNQQYFEHVSPSGVSVSDLVNQQGYQYIVVGENLALGNFGGDVNVMSAWMASPGHRANILNSQYQDIGVAVGKGMYQGKMQWLAVQHFGKPLSACPAVDSQLKSSIDSTRTDLQTKEQQISDEKADIDISNQSDPTYPTKVDNYNNDVSTYNNEYNAFKIAIDQYNESVVAFNTCAGLQTATSTTN